MTLAAQGAADPGNDEDDADHGDDDEGQAQVVGAASGQG